MGLRPQILISAIGFFAYGLNAQTPASPEADPSSAPAAQTFEEAAADMLNPGEVVYMPLTDLKTYMVGISGQIPTTIMLPSVPESFEGTGFANKPGIAAPVFISHEPGTTFFTVKPLLRGATADLNIILKGKIYSFKFFHSKKPTRALTLFDPPKNFARSNSPGSITFDRLHAIIKQVKSYFVMKENYPEMFRDIEHTEPGTVIPYIGYKVIVDQGFRFNADDTIVFRLVFSNDTFEPIYYRRDTLAVRVGLNIYDASFADLSGEIPAATPGRISLQTVSPEVSLNLTFPNDSTITIHSDSLPPLSEPGEYTLTLSRKGYKGELVRFRIYPVSDMTLEQSRSQEVDVSQSSLAKSVVIHQPRAGQSWGYLAITGNPDGTRAELSMKNEFNILVETEKMAVTHAPSPAPQGQGTPPLAAVPGLSEPSGRRFAPPTKP